jgi:hypothetical protein
MAASRNDLCPCGSGKKYKKCCLGAPDPKAVKKKNILLYGTLGLILVTAAVFLLAGQGVGAAVGMASFGLIIGYALASSSASVDPRAAKAAKGPGKAASRKKR